MQCQAQGPSTVNEHQMLPIAVATLTELHEVFDGRVVHAGDDLDHRP
jgi:hypothetical protein